MSFRFIEPVSCFTCLCLLLVALWDTDEGGVQLYDAWFCFGLKSAPVQLNGVAAPNPDIRPSVPLDCVREECDCEDGDDSDVEEEDLIVEENLCNESEVSESDDLPDGWYKVDQTTLRSGKVIPHFYGPGDLYNCLARNDYKGSKSCKTDALRALEQ